MVTDYKNCCIIDPVKKIEQSFAENQWVAEEELGNNSISFLALRKELK